MMLRRLRWYVQASVFAVCVLDQEVDGASELIRVRGNRQVRMEYPLVEGRAWIGRQAGRVVLNGKGFDSCFPLAMWLIPEMEEDRP